MQYQQITYEERRCIAKTLETDPEISRAKIARRLGRSKSAVCEEIRRNRCPDGRYLACEAEEKTRVRKCQSRGAYKKDNPYALEAIKDGLDKKWSPKIIAAKLKERYPEDRHRQLSHQTIYEVIWENKACGGDWCKGLPHGRRRRKKRYGKPERRGQIKNRVSIEERPEIVARKERVGDWEGDSVAGCKGGGGLVSMVDRRTQYVVLQRLKDGTARELNRSAVRGFRRHGELPHETLTVDNGREFSDHESLSGKLRLDVYFAHPYHAWERGLNEQINGMVRWWFPKGTDFNKVSDHEVRRVEKLLNERPREKLGYRTPAEVMRELTVRLRI